MKKKANVDIPDAPFTKSESKQAMEQYADGQRYLTYKSVSGMDLMPRIREPTPEKVLDQKITPRDCGGCKKY
jgi:hypothetical protein